ncbi:PRC-barrel domain-containing protein [Geodermatophilus sp. FMUSA9-8]|uniref:PRC-barrel domain-containing protein n=1 Tax=Geodermatophilus sp. FMUSA9-8 TaxID=3120155 RepID=UPI00300B01FA
MTLPDRDQVTDWIGKTVVDRDGNEIGTVTALLADEDTGQPEWLYAEHAGSTVVVPLVGAAGSGEHVQVAVERGLVDGAPRYGESRELSTDQEAALYRHYGIRATTSESDSLLPAEGAEPEAATVVGGPDTDPVPLPDAPADAAPVAEELPAPPPVAQPGDRDFGRTEQPAGGAAGRIGAAVAAALAVGAVVFALLRRRQQPTARVSRGARRTARKAQRSASRSVSRAGRETGRKAAKAGRKAAKARRSAASVPATGRARIEQVTAAAAPVVTGAVHQVREATRSGAAAAGPAVSGAVQQVREATRSGAAAAGPAVSNAAAQVLGATRSGAAAAAPLLATTGHALQTGANAGAEVARQALGAGAGLAAAAVTKAAEAGAEIGQTGLRAAMRAERAVGQVPEEVAEAGHRLKKKGKRLVRMTALGAGLGAGYVVGAGYGDYGQIQQLAGRVTGRS